MPERPTTSWPQRLHSTAEYDLLQPSAWKKWKWKWKILPFSFFGFQHRGFFGLHIWNFPMGQSEGSAASIFSLISGRFFSTPESLEREREREREKESLV